MSGRHFAGTDCLLFFIIQYRAAAAKNGRIFRAGIRVIIRSQRRHQHGGLKNRVPRNALLEAHA